MGRLTPPVLLLTLLACGGGSRSEFVTVRDSAGVSIVENREGQFSSAAQWTLNDPPLLYMAEGSEPEVVLYQVSSILPLSPDRFAVLSRGTYEVFVFDLAGQVTAQFGSEGDGPGEFRRPGSLLLVPPDSIGVFDSSHRRLSVFDSSGSLGREFTFELDAGESGGFRLLSLDNGDFVVGMSAGFGEGSLEGIYRTEAEWFVVGQGGTRKASFGMVLGSELFAVPGSMGSPLFGARTHAATLGSNLIVGFAEDPELLVFAPEGDLRRIIRWPDRDRTISESRVEAFVEEAAATAPEPVRARTRESLMEMPRKEIEPAYEGILSSDQGMFWVGSPEGPEADYLEIPPPQRTWLVFDSTGVIAATVEIPVGFRPLAMGASLVYGVAIGQLGDQAVAVYEIRKQ